MKILKKIGIVLAVLTICTSAFGDDTSSQKSGKRRPGPPPEAYQACEGKSAGDTAEIVTSRGDTLTGTCEQEGNKLVLKPDNFKGGPGGGPGGPGGKRNAPPSEAIEACEGKSAGDTAEFVNERGDTVTGTCEQRGDQLMLRPDNPPPGRNAD